MAAPAVSIALLGLGPLPGIAIVGGVVVASLAAWLLRKSRKKSSNNSKQCASRLAAAGAAPKIVFQWLGRMWADIRPSIQPLQLWLGATVLRVSATVFDVFGRIASTVSESIHFVDNSVERVERICKRFWNRFWKSFWK